MFSTPDFNSDRFLANRRRLTLDELKKELNMHLKSLKSELVEMINRDYASFVDISTNLKGVDKSWKNERKNQLSHRASIREKKASLQLLINIHESVRKVENLLLISSESASSLLSKDDCGNSAKQIERVAIEYNQMQIPGQQRERSTFCVVSSALRSALHSVKNQSNDASPKETLTQILRTYALIDQTKSAESVIRTELVAPSIHELVSHQAQPIPYTSAMSSTRPATKASKARYNLQYSKEPLALMYNRILTLINTDWFVLLEITRKILKGHRNLQFIDNNYVHIKEIFIIFAQPHILRGLHEEMAATSLFSIARFKEISSQVENALITAIDIQVDSDNDLQSTLKLPASKLIIFAIERCWADDVFVYGLSHRFWKLTLQLIQRYKNWLLLGLTDLLSETHSQGNDKLDSPVLRPSNSPAGNNLAPVEVQAKRLLKLLTIVGHDVDNMTLKIKETYQEHIITRLPESINDQPAIEGWCVPIRDVLQSISSSLSSMQSDLPDLNQKIATILTKRCIETLRQHIRSVIAQFRGSITKPPTEASYFVPHIIKPLITFCKVNKQLLRTDGMNHLTTLKKTEESSKIMKRLKKGKSTRSSFFAGNSNGDGNDESGALMNDEDKIRLQILLDLTNIGLNPLEIKGYTELCKVVEPYSMILKKLCIN
ncbi:hypothetical protein C2G38_2171963 [Gigaspora rosea]|uniref:Conserved oligomeric Golgi complex subunit 2 n=1 Tax=Gigaspora rosea TaxID=44941 RepID=A0A397VQD8_9GLOM|nr:hypothetical protein C2G38_2171963 [Gigaspora rosea]